MSDSEIALLLRQHGGVLRAADHPHLRHRLRRLAQRSLLTTMFPGVFVASSTVEDVRIRIRAAAAYVPDGVVVRRAAAWLTFWPTVPVGVVEVASPVSRRDHPGLEMVRWGVPSDWVVEHRGARFTRAGLTAIDLVPQLGGAVVCEAFRARVPMDELWSALEATPNRPGNDQRRRLLHDYRGRPWSEAEQVLHTLLRAAKISGWVTNLGVMVNGVERSVDVALTALRIAIEVDGYGTHGYQTQNREQFETDRLKTSWLTARGWKVLRFTWRQLIEQPEWVIDTIRRTVRSAQRQRS